MAGFGVEFFPLISTRLDGVMAGFGVEFFPLIYTRLDGVKELLYSRHINKAHHSRTSPFGSAPYANARSFHDNFDAIFRRAFLEKKKSDR
jgi:hypothetical protein